MSAYILNKKHVDVLVDYANRHDCINHFGKGIDPADLNQIGQIIVNENYKSINARYNDSCKPPVYEWQHPGREYSGIEIIKACDCAHYQLCETKTYRRTKAHRIIESIRNKAIRSLPGWSAAAWEIN